MVWYQPKSPTPSSWDEDSSRAYVVSSVLLWVAFSIGGFYFLTDFSVTSELSVDTALSGGMIVETATAATILILATGAVGFALSLPVVFVYRFVSSHIESLHKRSWNVPAIQVTLLKAIPYLAFIFVHFIALTASFSIAPHFSRRLSDRPSFLSSWSRLIYDEVYAPYLNATSPKLWEPVLSKQTKSAFVVLLPSSVMSSPNLLSATKREMGEPLPVFIDSTNFGSELVQILEGSTGFQSAFYSPFLTTSELMPMRKITAAGEFSLAPLAATFSTEHRALQNLLREETETRDNSTFHVRNTIRKRLAFSQPQLFLFFRSNWLKFFYDMWSWSELVVDDNYRLKKILSEQINPSDRLRIVQLSELEQTDETLFHPLTGMRWPANLKLTEKQQIIAELDQVLAEGVRLAKKETASSFFILPYVDSGKSPSASFAYAFAPAPELSNNIARAKSDQNMLTPRELAFFIRDAIGDSSNEKIVAPAEGPSCIPVFYPFRSIENLEKPDGLRRALWNFVQLDEKGFYTVVPKLKFFFKLEREYGVYCRGPIAEANGRQQVGPWLLRLDSSENDPARMTESEGALRNRIFHAPPAPPPTNKRARKLVQQVKRDENKETRETKDLRFVLYQLVRDDRAVLAPKAADEALRQLFYTQFKPLLTPALDEITRGQLLWD